MFNRIFMTTLNRANNYFTTQGLYSNETVDADKLFERTWKIIQKDYYDPSMNHQDWNKWKNRYFNKIETIDDAKIAIDSMLASLNEPYTRFMDKKEY